jgi:vacuolar-type H+-ATPase subunit F/Vma7
MPAPIFIGDELSAAGYRLAGALVRVPDPGEEAAALEWASTAAELVLVSAECAAQIPRKQLDAALSRMSPLVLVVPDACGESRPEDIAASIRRQLGMQP